VFLQQKTTCVYATKKPTHFCVGFHPKHQAAT
jgi:hypothetical protein